MRVKAVALALALMTSLVSVAESADKTVWRVGVFDSSSGELAGGQPHGAVHFVALRKFCVHFSENPPDDPGLLLAWGTALVHTGQSEAAASSNGHFAKHCLVLAD